MDFSETRILIDDLFSITSPIILCLSLPVFNSFCMDVRLHSDTHKLLFFSNFFQIFDVILQYYPRLFAIPNLRQISQHPSLLYWSRMLLSEFFNFTKNTICNEKETRRDISISSDNIRVQDCFSN